MRAVSVILVLACAAAVAFATDLEADTEAEVDVETFTDAEAEADAELSVPVLPGMDQGCLPTYSKRNYRSRAWKKHVPQVVSFGGKCVAETSCPAADSEPGYCAGIGVTCCKSVSAAAPAAASASASSMPVLRNGATPCATQGGSCIDVSTCTGTTQSGLCPGLPNSVKCCFPKPTPPTPTPTTSPCSTQGGVCQDASTCTGTTQSGLCPGTPAATKCCFKSTGTPALTTLVSIPLSTINKDSTGKALAIAGASVLTAALGKPGCPLTTSCFSCTCQVQNALISRNLITVQITPSFKLTGIAPYINAVKRAFDAMKAAGATDPVMAQVYSQARTAGGLCCRPIKRSDGSAGGSWSNHSWGCAADFYFGANIDPRGDGKTQYGLLRMAPFMNAEGLFWAAAYRGSEEDAMHFEASSNALSAWKSQGLIK